MCWWFVHFFIKNQWNYLTFLLIHFFLNYSNLDPLTETYGLSFYMQYLAHWPEYFQVAESPSGEIMGYSKWIWILCSFKFAPFRLDLCLSNNCLRCIWLDWDYLLLVLWLDLTWNKTNWIFFLTSVMNKDRGSYLCSFFNLFYFYSNSHGQSRRTWWKLARSCYSSNSVTRLPT